MTDLYETGPSYDLTIDHMRWGEFGPATGGASALATTVFAQTVVDLESLEHRQLIDELVPVREFFEQETLGFENLMQRDLDDNRVSNDLIPYLLEGDSGGARMFPSILVLLLPARDKRLEDFYLPQQPDAVVSRSPNMEEVTAAYGDGDREYSFAFTRLRKPGGTLLPYGARLQVNKQLCRFVIVDGQHRAMALLALNRNLSRWPEEGKAFRHFYQNHSREKLIKAGVDRSRLALPVTICFFPNLHTSNSLATAGDHRVVKAARKLFLDVNRTAKQPSQARQILLDDSRISSEFVRAIMTRIKDEPTTDGLRLWNLFYDQIEDYQSSLPKAAVTSVLHIVYMIRMLLLARQPRSGASLLRRTDFSKYNPGDQRNSNQMRSMLSWEEEFGEDALRWTDDTVPAEHRAAVTAHFMDKWGRLVLKFLNEFPVYTALAQASRETKEQIEQSEVQGDDLVRRMLFEGQGVREVHSAVCKRISRQDDGPYPYPDSSRSVFERQSRRLDTWENTLLERAAELYFGASSSASWPPNLSDEDKRKLVVKFSTVLGAKFAKTKAFQVGVIAALGDLERCLDEGDREVFWSEKIPDVLLQEVCVIFEGPGFPGRNTQHARLAEWTDALSSEHWPSAVSERGVYRFAREVYGGELQDGKWTFIKYVVFEMFNSRLNTELPKVEVAGPDAEDVINRIARRVAEGVEEYREKLVKKETAKRIERYAADHGEDPAPDTQSRIRDEVVGRLKREIAFSFKYEPDLEGLADRARDSAADTDDEEEDVDDDGGHQSPDGE